MEKMNVEKERVAQEERRKTINEETKHHQQRAQYQDQLARFANKTIERTKVVC